MNGKYVFISYKVEDAEDAGWVKSTLEANGIPCWMAPDSIPGGSSYATEIEKAISGCSAFVLILSEKAQGSKWVSKELDRAINHGKRVMPYTLDDAPLKDDFSFYLSNVQRYDATSDKLAAIRTMIEDIGKEFSMQNVPYVFTKKPPKTKENGRRKKMKLWKKILIAVIISPWVIWLLAIIFFPEMVFGETEPNLSNNITGSDTSAYNEYFEQPSNNFYETPQTNGYTPSLSTLNINKNNLFFYLEGVKYTLPCSYSDLKNNGWELYSDQYSETSIIGNDAVIKMYKEGKFIELEIYNVCGDPLELCYCTVGGITVWYNYGVDFMTPYGGAIGSTRDKIINTYGEPDFTDTYDDYFQYYYTFNDEYGYISTCHYSDTKECYMIELKNIVY
ncbi:MAG: toll/interleukin-1 receptor domain-containing protein [Acutalibacteraceae bacterium]|nr:toll/interleukin-1 receptor domain-containing protein [Acutalibacteraceae bacterium]